MALIKVIKDFNFERSLFSLKCQTPNVLRTQFYEGSISGKKGKFQILSLTAFGPAHLYPFDLRRTNIQTIIKLKTSKIEISGGSIQG